MPSDTLHWYANAPEWTFVLGCKADTPRQLEIGVDLAVVTIPRDGLNYMARCNSPSSPYARHRSISAFNTRAPLG